MAWLIYSTQTGEELRRSEIEPELAEGEAAAIVSLAPGAVWSPELRGFVDAPQPLRLTGLQVLGLLTPAQHARGRRLLVAVYPPGHPWAGQLVDPDALVQRLFDATLAMPGTIAVDDPLHINGMTLLRGLGVLESDEELARVLAGVPPEQQP